MRTKLIAGNWKMNKDVRETTILIDQLRQQLADIHHTVGVVICPPFTSLSVAQAAIAGTPIRLGAQNMSEYDDGAYTGEISARMLVAAGCRYVILGHSERRQYFGETDERVNLRAKKALAAGLIPILCVGETLQERETGVTDEVVSRQIRGVLSGLTAGDVENSVIAYEPVWAIGTGKNATPEQANQVHSLIRQLVKELYSEPVSAGLVIQYGEHECAECSCTSFAARY